MRLIGVDIAGYRRFLQASIDLDSNPLAVIGRNEAGKSSLLEALVSLNGTDPIEGADQTRGQSFPGNHRVLTAWFALEKDDLDALSEIPELADSRIYQISKSVDGTLRGGFHPYAARDLERRRRALGLHGRVAATRWYAESDVEEEDFERAGLALRAVEETLRPDAIQSLETLADQLPEEPERSLPQQFRAALLQLLEHERAPTPSKRAAGILIRRRPRFVLFEQEHRDLDSVYELSALAADPPAALRNLAALADLSLEDALAAQQRGDYGRLERVIRDANETLEGFFSTAWRQSSMHVQLRIDQTELRILVDNLQGDLTGISERSAGLQTFVALVAFLAQEEYDTPPVVLIDEAETHLHYDAQADLVRVFSEQDAAAKVVYTTHSAGCLPLDLGLGVRAVVAQTNDTSTIANSMWELGSGLSPILLAMGASVLAFTRARRAIIGEGASEALLLPTLLKEAVDPAEVDYQIAPGVANASSEAITELEAEAVAVGYVLDGDKGGRDHAKRLLDAGIPAERILFLGGSPTSGVTLEDLVSRELFATAVNEVFSTWHPDATFPISAVTATGRSASLATWCRRRHIPPPDKKRVAARLLDAKRAERSRLLSSQSGRSALRRLHAEVNRVLSYGGPQRDDAP